MPHRVVRIERWQVVAAFVFLAASYVVMGVLLKHATDRNSAAIREIRALRAESIARFRKTDLEVCRRPLELIHTLILASDASLGKPGSPGAAYYRAHPGELRQAHLANRAFASRSDPAQCTRLPSQQGVTP